MQVLSPEEMLPAVAQGAIGIECREDDTRVRDFLAQLDDALTRLRAEAERSVLAVLDGSCRTPIAALAEIDRKSVVSETIESARVAPGGSSMPPKQTSEATA